MPCRCQVDRPDPTTIPTMVPAVVSKMVPTPVPAMVPTMVPAMVPAMVSQQLSSHGCIDKDNKVKCFMAGLELTLMLKWGVIGTEYFRAWRCGVMWSRHA